LTYVLNHFYTMMKWFVLPNLHCFCKKSCNFVSRRNRSAYIAALRSVGRGIVMMRLPSRSPGPSGPGVSARGIVEWCQVTATSGRMIGGGFESPMTPHAAHLCGVSREGPVPYRSHGDRLACNPVHPGVSWPYPACRRCRSTVPFHVGDQRVSSFGDT